jgi:predicted RNase H-like nuclease
MGDALRAAGRRGCHRVSEVNEEACAENMRVTGRKISRQTWNIMPKIKEGDDFLDAIVLAVTAQCAKFQIYTLPKNPLRDSIGLPMEIVYATSF